MTKLLKRNSCFLCGLSFLFYLHGCGDPSRDRNGKVFRYNEPAGITSLDPAFARDQANIWAVNQLFSGLVQLNDDLEVLPLIAYRWEQSEDGLVLTFHLRRDVYFHDNQCFEGDSGRRVNAADFVFSFGRILDPATASPGAWIFNMVDTSGTGAFIARDDSTLIIRLKKPYQPFLGLLAMPYCVVVPEEAVSYYGNAFRSNPVGTGPFQFKRWKEGIKLVLVRNGRYFEYEGTARLPYLDAVAVTFLPDRQAAFLEFVKGNLDFMSGIDPAYKDELLTRSGTLKPEWEGRIGLISQPYLNTEYLGFLMDTTVPAVQRSPLGIRKVRQALNLCFDRNKMIRFLRNNIGTPGHGGIIPKGMPGYDPEKVFYSYDPDKARDLLAEAGFPGGKGLPPITLISTPDYLDICKYIQHEASLVGIELRIEINPPAAVKEMRAQARVPFFRASWIADYPDAENYLSLFYSPNFCPRGPNYTRFSDERFDRLFEQSLSVKDDPVRYAMYRAMEEIVMSDSPVVILYYDVVLRFIQPGVEGIGSNPMNLLSLKRVSKN